MRVRRRPRRALETGVPPDPPALARRGAATGVVTISATVLGLVLLQDLVRLLGGVIQRLLRRLLAGEGLVDRGGDEGVRLGDARRDRLVVRVLQLVHERLQVGVLLDERRIVAHVVRRRQLAGLSPPGGVVVHPLDERRRSGCLVLV